MLDYSQVARELAKYEKPFLREVDRACGRKYTAPLLDLLTRALQGNFRKAVFGKQRSLNNILDLKFGINMDKNHVIISSLLVLIKLTPNKHRVAK